MQPARDNSQLQASGKLLGGVRKVQSGFLFLQGHFSYPYAEGPVCPWGECLGTLSMLPTPPSPPFLFATFKKYCRSI